MPRAAELAKRALAISPRSPLAHFANAEALRAQGRSEEAIPEYETALASNRNWVEAIAALGWCKFFAGDLDEVIPLHELAIRLSPRDPSLAIYYGIAGYARFMTQQYDEAVALAREAIRHRGDLTGAYRVLTVSAAMSGDTQTAAAALAELRRTQPSISLAWIATQLPWRSDADREHFLEGFRRAGLT